METEVRADYVNDDNHYCLTKTLNKNNDDSSIHGISTNVTINGKKDYNSNENISMPINDNNEIDFTTPIQSRITSIRNEK